MTVLLALSALVGCWAGLLGALPSEPCPGDSSGADRPEPLVLLQVGAILVLLAVLSIVGAWWGVSRTHRRPWPWLVASMVGLTFSALLLFLIFRVMSALSC
ncbi:hypothetical protein KRMM14A1004_49370 [Krasilnikovia sp. MM14-A1004]